MATPRTPLPRTLQGICLPTLKLLLLLLLLPLPLLLLLL
jgi:hypothetical protein